MIYIGDQEVEAVGFKSFKSERRQNEDIAAWFSHAKRIVCCLLGGKSDCCQVGKARWVT
jgi:hypothetical protein